MNAKEINRISIKNYLAELNILPAKDRGYYGLYHSPFREDYNASMKVDFEKNLWIDYGANIGGTLIDLVMQIEKLRSSYASAGHDFGINKAKKLKSFLENKRMILKEDKFYKFNPDFITKT